MIKALVTSAAVISMLAFGGMPFAAASPSPSAPSQTNTGQTDIAKWAAQPSGFSYSASKFDNNTVSHASVTLRQAIANAAKAGHGSALDGFLEQQDGKAIYRVRVLQSGGQIATEEVDAVTGRVSNGHATIPSANWTAMERQEVANLDHAKLPLDQAIAVAEKKTEAGKAVDANVSDHLGELAYNVDLVNKGTVEPVQVRPAQPMNATSNVQPTT